VGYCAVGDSLRRQNAPDEAIDYYEKARRIDPTYARAHSNLGLSALDLGLVDEAIDDYRKAVQLDPDYAWAHSNLANALRLKGRLDEALDHYQQALRLDPNNLEVETGIRSVLMRQGRGRELLARWRKALEADPPEHDAWFGYAELCLFLGEQEEYRRARRALLDRFGSTADPFVAERTSRACLLLPASGDELRKAAALADRAVAARGSTQAWIYRYFLFARGLAEYRQGRLASAVSLMGGEASRVMGPSPRLILAMAQHDQGRMKEARTTLAKAVVAFDWGAREADSRDVWICHILRREAEAKILPELPAFLQGTYQPQENDERLALLGVCQSRGLHAAAARLYADAFAADRALAENSALECRCHAARCAAMAGCGLGEDGAALSGEERTRWRRQAREWLQADLAVRAKVLDGGSRAARIQLRNMLTQWQADPGLAGLRDPGALEQWSTDERKECRALWDEVSAVLHRACAVR
jgi:serine/threonine-protein kinase